MRSIILILSFLLGAGQATAQQVLSEKVTPPFAVPTGEGLFRISAAEPIGRGGLNFRYMAEAYRISVGKVGEGSSLTGHLGIGYGLANSVDLLMSVPLLFDIVGGLAKYGTGDINTALKFGFPGKVLSSYYFGFDFSVLHPIGYKERQALNVRPFSREVREMSSKLMLDLNRDAAGFRLNAGYLISSGSRAPGLMYGVGVEVGRNQVFTMTAEYLREPSAIAGAFTTRAVLGAQMNLWRLKLEAGFERGLSDDLPSVTAIAGIRLRPKLGAIRKREARTRVRIPKDVETSVRVAVVNFSGFEHRNAGILVADQIKTAVSRYGHIQVVLVGEGTAFLDPDAAMNLARKSDVDVVITGRVLQYEMNRSAKPNVPLVLGLPNTQAQMEADIRIVDRRAQGQVLSFLLSGTGRQGRGIRMFPTSRDDRTSYLNAVEKERIWTEAIQEMVSELMREMADRFKWFPG